MCIGWDLCLGWRKCLGCGMNIGFLTEFEVCILLFDCLDVRGDFNFVYGLCLGCNLYFRCGLDV
jgi:hypothetical protein